MSITIKLLLSITTATTPTTNDVSDVCDVVYRDTGTPLICKLHPEGAPVYDGEVCCTGTSCVPASSTCEESSLYRCELGEQRADGEVDCYVEVPNYCDVFPCGPGFQAQPLAEAMCCSQGICWPTSAGANDCELQDIYWCDSGVSNPDGTVTCLDD